MKNKYSIEEVKTALINIAIKNAVKDSGEKSKMDTIDKVMKSAFWQGLATYLESVNEDIVEDFILNNRDWSDLDEKGII